MTNHQGWLAHLTADTSEVVTIVSDDDDLRLIHRRGHDHPEWVPRDQVRPAAQFLDRGPNPEGPPSINPAQVTPDWPYPTRDGKLLHLGDRVEATGTGSLPSIITGNGVGIVTGFAASNGLIVANIANETDGATTLVPLAQLRKASP